MGVLDWLCIFALCSLFFSLTSASNDTARILVALPNTLYVGVDQTAQVSAFNGTDEVDVLLHISTAGGGSYETETVTLGTGSSSANLSIKLPFRWLNEQDRTATVEAGVTSRSSSHQLISPKTTVSLKRKTLSLFIQTDKPVYFEKDTVRMRFVMVKRNLRSPEKEVSIDVSIRNPDGILVTRFNSTFKPFGFSSHAFTLGPSPKTGVWKTVANYFGGSSSAEFRVLNYVLPRFEVKLTTPKYIRRDTERISITVEASYIYGKPVSGLLILQLGVLRSINNTVAIFKREYHSLKASGIIHVEVNNAQHYDLHSPDSPNFLSVNATVVERSSGISQSALVSTTAFTSSPIRLDCDLSPAFYHKFLSLDLAIRATYFDGEPVRNFLLSVRPENFTHLSQSLRRTNDKGIVSYRISTEDRSRINVKVVADIPRTTVQTETTCSFHPFPTLVMCRHREGIDVRLLLPQAVHEINFEVKSSVGKILANVLIVTCGEIRLSFFETVVSEKVLSTKIESDYCQEIYVVATYVSKCGHLVSDHTRLSQIRNCSNDVRVCVPKAEPVDFDSELLRLVTATKSPSLVALLGVDRGLLSFASNGQLSQENVLEEVASYDSSCRHSIDEVNVGSFEVAFDAAGLAVIATSFPNKRKSRKSLFSLTNSCLEKNRYKRAGQEKGCFCRFGKILGRNNENAAFCRKERQKIERKTQPIPCTGHSEQNLDVFQSCCESGQRGLNAPEQFFRALQEFSLRYDSPRYHFPHVFIWEEMRTETPRFIHRDDNQACSVGNKAIAERSYVLPHSITTWDVYGMAFSKSEGFCVSPVVSFRTWKPAFVDCHLPFSVNRGEWLTMPCTIYNYNPFPISTNLKMFSSSETCQGENTDDRFDIGSNDIATKHFDLFPLEVGEYPLKVKLGWRSSRESLDGGDEIIKTLRVNFEGVLIEYSLNAELDPQGLSRAYKSTDDDAFCVSADSTLELATGECTSGETGSGVADNRETLRTLVTKDECCFDDSTRAYLKWCQGKVCEECLLTSEYTCMEGESSEDIQINTLTIRVPDDHVKGSAKAWILTQGNLFLSSIEPLTWNLNLIEPAAGCGEQTLRYVSRNVAAMKYVFAKIDNETLKELLKDRAATGYQTQISNYYSKETGAFLLYPNINHNAWVTAFALEACCEASRFISIDSQLVSKSVSYLTSFQLQSGEFSSSHIYPSASANNMFGEDRIVFFTAYSLLSMSHCCNLLDSKNYNNIPEPQSNLTSICLAVQYLSNKISGNYVNLMAHTKAVIYAALTKAKNCGFRCNDELNANLIQRSREILDEASEITTTGAKFWPNTDDERIEAIEVETAAYALCGYVSAQDIRGAGPIAKWLVSVQKLGGNFVSTRDTSVALRCMADFYVSVPDGVNLTVEITAKRNKRFHHKIRLAEGGDLSFNSTHYKEIEIPLDSTINDTIRVKTSGTGYGSVGLRVEYYSDSPQIIKCRFKFSVKAEFENNGSILFTVLTRYNATDLKTKTGMAVIEITLPLGYVGCEETNDDYCLPNVNESTSDMEWYEQRDQKIMFYFDTISVQKTNFTFRAKKEKDQTSEYDFQIRQAQVYEYYTGEKCTVFYTVGRYKSCDKDLSICSCSKRCPKRKTKDRLQSACCDHDYAYKIEVVRVEETDSFQIISCTILHVLKTNRNVSAKGTLSFRLHKQCSKTFDQGKIYHLQGQDISGSGDTLVLDQTSFVEAWPEENNEKCRKLCLRNIEKSCGSSMAENESWICSHAKWKCNDKCPYFFYVEAITTHGGCEKQCQ